MRPVRPVNGTGRRPHHATRPPVCGAITALPSPAVADGRFVPAVQGLRGLAAFTVLVVHLYTMPLLAGIDLHGLPRWLHDLLISNGRGVELFFIISGFLIPTNLIRHASVSRLFYYRFLRIVPLRLPLALQGR